MKDTDIHLKFKLSVAVTKFTGSYVAWLWDVGISDPQRLATPLVTNHLQKIQFTDKSYISFKWIEQSANITALRNNYISILSVKLDIEIGLLNWQKTWLNPLTYGFSLWHKRFSFDTWVPFDMWVFPKSWHVGFPNWHEFPLDKWVSLWHVCFSLSHVIWSLSINVYQNFNLWSI